jgi:hypothetical protein
MTEYTTNIPLAREMLRAVAAELHEHAPDQSDRIIAICDDIMTRKPSGRRAPSTRAAVTPDIRGAVRHMLRTTNRTQEAIGAIFNIDGGRVSEIYTAMKRDDDKL